jgi:hypothetical protein
MVGASLALKTANGFILARLTHFCQRIEWSITGCVRVSLRLGMMSEEPKTVRKCLS